MTTRRPILLLTHSEDFYTIDRVAAAIERRGHRALRIDTDLYPTSIELSTDYGPDGIVHWLQHNKERLRLAEVAAFWTRRLWPGVLKGDLDPVIAQATRAASRLAFLDALAAHTNAYWLNAIPALVAAESKLVQFAAAKEVGLPLPPTLISNSAEALRRFATTHGEIVTKLLVPLSQTMSGSGAFQYTTRLRAESIAHLPNGRLAPQIYQKLIPPARELRVVVVEDRFFVGALDRRVNRAETIDWRQLSPSSCPRWTDGELPTRLRAQTLALLERLGLRFGACDFLVDDQGQYHFLEVNPAGEWGWLERDLDLPIADAIGEALVKGAVTCPES